MWPFRYNIHGSQKKVLKLLCTNSKLKTGIKALLGRAEKIDQSSSVFIVNVSMILSSSFSGHYNMEANRPRSPSSHQPTTTASDDLTQCKDKKTHTGQRSRKDLKRSKSQQSFKKQNVQHPSLNKARNSSCIKMANAKKVEETKHIINIHKMAIISHGKHQAGMDHT